MAEPQNLWESFCRTSYHSSNTGEWEANTVELWNFKIEIFLAAVALQKTYPRFKSQVYRSCCCCVIIQLGSLEPNCETKPSLDPKKTASSAVNHRQSSSLDQTRPTWVLRPLCAKAWNCLSSNTSSPFEVFPQRWALKTVHVIIHLRSEKKHGVQYKLVYAGIHTLFSLTWLDPGASLRRQPTW